MTATAALLLLLSAFLHAGWNLLGKRYHPTAAAFLIATFVGVLCLSPVLIIYREILGMFSFQSWLLVCLTGLCQTVYYTSLAGAYKTGDMSIAYPLARSAPVIIVTVLSLLLGRSEQISRQCLYGIILVVAGGGLLLMKRFDDLRRENYLNASCHLALLAAFGTAGYSMIDDKTLRLLRQASNATISIWQITLVYAFFETLSSSCWLTLYVFGFKHGRQQFREILTQHPGFAALMGVGIYLTYLLVLLSMAFVSNVSYVVAFRQTSILLGVVLSVTVLKEPAYTTKCVAVVVMFLGLLLVGAG